MTDIDHRAWQRDLDTIRGEIEAAAEDRGARDTFDAGTGELGWVIHERGIVHDAVNRLRARLGKGPADAADILSAERRAVGHSDYMTKFALAAADVVHCLP